MSEDKAKIKSHEFPRGLCYNSFAGVVFFLEDRNYLAKKRQKSTVCTPEARTFAVKDSPERTR